METAMWANHQLVLRALATANPGFYLAASACHIYSDTAAQQLFFANQFWQTWESVKPGVPKEVKGGYPEIKILGDRYSASLE